MTLRNLFTSKAVLNSNFSLLGIPFQQLPALEVDGKVIVGQSMAIARYIARYTESKKMTGIHSMDHKS